MPKIAYAVRWNVGEENGVVKKVAEQIRLWMQLGCEVRLFALSPEAKIWSGISDLPVEMVSSPQRSWREFIASGQLFQSVIKWQPDIVYLRSMIYLPSIEKLLRSLPVVVEVNTKEVSEKALSGSKLRGFYRRLTQSRVLGQAKGIVAVTQEIAHDMAKFARPTAVIANGITLESFPRLPPAANKMPRLVFLGSRGMRWHGVDKIVELADYLPDFHFDIIGESELPMSLPNLKSHGILSKVNYLEVLASADVALGTLALHRKNMAEACPLKVREYLACGIPTIIGYSDTDFTRPVPFILQLPNSPDNVQNNVEQIAQFAFAWKGRRVIRDDVKHLDNWYKESQRLVFFEQLLAE